MSTKAEELIRLDRVVKDGEIRLNTIGMNLESTQKDIDDLTLLRDRLKQNIDCLKKNKVVAIASEYKKIKNELTRVNAAMTQAQNIKQDFIKSENEISGIIKDTKAEIDKLNSVGNVLQGKFGKKNG